MMQAAKGVLLDTCAVIWLSSGDDLSDRAAEAIVEAGMANALFVSATSAWEIGMLSRTKAGRAQAIQFLPDPKSWFRQFLGGAGVSLAPISPEIAIEASYLPGDIHGDPADRLIVATGRHLNLPIVTRDRKIIDYAERGFAQVIPC